MNGIQEGPPQINFDISKTTSVKCDKCGNETFQEVTILRYLSAIASPTSKATHIPIPTYACNGCGHINLQFIPAFMRPEAPANTPTPNLTLVK